MAGVANRGRGEGPGFESTESVGAGGAGDDVEWGEGVEGERRGWREIEPPGREEERTRRPFPVLVRDRPTKEVCGKCKWRN